MAAAASPAFAGLGSQHLFRLAERRSARIELSSKEPLPGEGVFQGNEGLARYWRVSGEVRTASYKKRKTKKIWLLGDVVKSGTLEPG